MVAVHVSLKLEVSWDFFSRSIERRPKQIVLIHFLEYDYSQLGATRLAGYLSSHIQHALVE